MEYISYMKIREINNQEKIAVAHGECISDITDKKGLCVSFEYVPTLFDIKKDDEILIKISENSEITGDYIMSGRKIIGTSSIISCGGLLIFLQKVQITSPNVLFISFSKTEKN